MKTSKNIVLAFLVMAGILAISESLKGVCFKKYSKNGCRSYIKINGKNSSTLEGCCKNGGAGWSLTRSRIDRKTCTSCKAVHQIIRKNTKGVCFEKYSKKDGCRKYIQTNGRTTGTIEECCRGGGSGWSVKKSDRRICTPCDNVDTSFWGTWGQWSTCSATCGQTFQQRKRNCKNSNGKPNCRGNGSEKKRCKKLPLCPVDGGWSEWSQWSSCSVSCGKGQKIQKRSCTNPRPMNGGRECQGKFENWGDCEDLKNCPIDGGWGSWASWGKCSKTCGLGMKRRTRECDSPKPQYDGKPCDTNGNIGVDYCREERCLKTVRAEICGGRSEECTSGSGSGWDINSGSGEGSSGSGLGSGFGSVSGEGSGGKAPNNSDDEEL